MQRDLFKIFSLLSIKWSTAYGLPSTLNGVPVNGFQDGHLYPPAPLGY